MDDQKKLLFLQNMAHIGLSHTAKVPNTPTPDGKMSHDKMLSFVNSIASKGLQHLAAGGTPIAQTSPSGSGTSAGGIGGFFSGVLGTDNNYQPNGAPITSGTSPNQINNAYSQAQVGLEGQKEATGTLTGQLDQGVASQQNLTNLYTNQANGVGPNPAQAQLNQATGQNIAQQAALAAGQRGAGANAGLIAAQNAQQGAATQQQAVGQAATLGAQQQIAAESNLQNLGATQVSQGLNAQQGLNNATQNEQNILQGANTNFNNTNVAQQSNLNNINASISTANQNAAGNAVSGVFGAATGANIAGSLFAEGGKVEDPHWVKVHQNMMAAGGVIGESTNAPSNSFVANWLNSNIQTQAAPSLTSTPINTGKLQGLPGIGGGKPTSSPGAAPGGEAGAEAGGGEGAEAGADAGGGIGILAAAHGGKINYKSGGPVPGKAKVGRDSYSNDTVPALLSPGEVVIDLNTLKDPGPLGKKARFVAASIERLKKAKGGTK